MLNDEEIIEGNKLLDVYFKPESYENTNLLEEISEFSWRHKSKYHESWDWLFPLIDKINSMGKEFSFATFKTYVSCTVEKGGNKMYKDYSFANSEYITANQTSKEAAFKLLVKFVKWHNEHIKQTQI